MSYSAEDADRRSGKKEVVLQSQRVQLVTVILLMLDRVTSGHQFDLPDGLAGLMD